MHQPFFHASQETRVRLRDKSFANGDQVRRHHSNPDVWLVSAQSFSTESVRGWYKVSVSQATCTCKGFHLRGICRHLCRVSWEAWLTEQKSRYANVIPFPAPQIAA